MPFQVGINNFSLGLLLMVVGRVTPLEGFQFLLIRDVGAQIYGELLLLFALLGRVRIYLAFIILCLLGWEKISRHSFIHRSSFDRSFALCGMRSFDLYGDCCGFIMFFNVWRQKLLRPAMYPFPCKCTTSAVVRIEAIISR
jgi:hypothetical protein